MSFKFFLTLFIFGCKRGTIFDFTLLMPAAEIAWSSAYIDRSNCFFNSAKLNLHARPYIKLFVYIGWSGFEITIRGLVEDIYREIHAKHITVGNKQLAR